MIKQTVEISAEPVHLASRMGQLVFQRKDKVVGQTACEDVGMVVVDHPQTTYTHQALSQLAASDAVLVICGDNHMPIAMMLPLADHTQIVWRVHDQIELAKPMRKQLWRQLVVAKIFNQAMNLPEEYPARSALLAMSRRVKSGDPENLEAQAAKTYWSNWLWPEEFRRDSDQEGVNSFLNYGYAIVRAAVARAIVSAGLMPCLGLHHCNRSNHFCLADDLIEPWRPFVDDRVREMWRAGYDTLNQPAKAELLKLLEMSVMLGGEKGPLMVAMHRFVGSLVRCYAGESKMLEVPVACS
jgi:CRISPR-associated protein Cas1